MTRNLENDNLSCIKERTDCAHNEKAIANIIDVIEFSYIIVVFMGSILYDELKPHQRKGRQLDGRSIQEWRTYVRTLPVWDDM